MRGPSTARRLGGLVGALALCSALNAPVAAGAVAPDCRAAPESCTTRELADAAGVTLGVAAQPGLLANDADYAEVVRTTFTSITPENELKWLAVQPERGVFDFAPADATIGWAEAEGLVVKGHTLVWEQTYLDGQPGWVLDLDDPTELWDVVDDHLTTVLTHTAGRVDRWDVVNEPLEFAGTALACNHYARVVGPDYVARALRRAHGIDPNLTLVVNENRVQYQPEKADALVALAGALVADGVPLDGIGLQMHLVDGPPAPGVVHDLVTRLRALGLEVAITELDVATLPDRGGEAGQVATYRQVLTEYFQAGGREVTIWGVDDGHSWLPNAPLLFDADYQPKPALDAVREAIVNHVLDAPPPAPVPPIDPSTVAEVVDGCDRGSTEPMPSEDPAVGAPAAPAATPRPGAPTLTG